jgi:hypothetical protein
MAGPETRFQAKTWIYLPAAIFMGLFVVFGLIMGLLFLTGTMKRVDGRPATDAGIAITAVTLGFCLPAFCAAVFNLQVRRAPLVRICLEGIEARLIGQTSLDGVPLVPAAVRFYWGFISTQSFRNRALRTLWTDVRGAQVTGLPSMRILAIDGVFREIPDGVLAGTAPVTHRVIFQQVDFKKPLQDVANAIAFYTANPSIRHTLPSWSEPR